MPRRTPAALVDTHVVLRFLLADDAVQSPLAVALFGRAAEGRILLDLEDGVLAETVWVLERFARVPRLEIARHLAQLLGLRGIRVHGGIRCVLEALASYGSTPCDFVDCLLSARARARHSSVFTFDVTDFGRLPCSWQEPS